MNLLNPGVFIIGFCNTQSGDVSFMSGSDIGPSSTLEKQVLTRGVSSRGDVTQLNHKWELNLQFANKDVYDELVAIPKNGGTQFEIWKLNGFFTWRETTDMQIDEQVLSDPESEDYPYTLRMTFTGPDPEIKESLNYLAPWKGTDSPYWNVTGSFDSISFNGTRVTVNTNASGSIDVVFDIFTPFTKGSVAAAPDLSLVFKARIGALPTGATLTSLYKTYDANNDFGVSVEGDPITTGGLQEIVTVVPSTNVRYEIGFRISNLTEATLFRFEEPTLYQGRSELTTDFTNY